MLQLQAIVERVAKTMGPVEEGQGNEDEEVKSRHRVPDQAADGFVARGLEPSKRDSQPSQQDMDREEERGHRSPRAEEKPQKRRDRPRHLSPPQHDKAHGPGENQPGRIVEADNDPVGHALAFEPDHDGLGSQVEPRNGMEKDEEKRDGVEGDEERSEEHTSELQSPCNLVCRLLLEKKKTGT